MTVDNLSQANQFYDRVVPAAIHLCRDWYGLKSLEFKPRDGSALQDRAGSSVKLVADGLMCPISYDSTRWSKWASVSANCRRVKILTR